jgi:Fe-S cluster assembly ATP-binding protein
MSKNIISINNLHAGVEDKEILKGINLDIGYGEVHAIMGPNGSGKSSLSNVLAGRDTYEITSGSVHYKDEDLLSMSVQERAANGVFLSFQYPIEIPGVANITFLKESLNSQRKLRGEDEMSTPAFMKLLYAKAEELGIKREMLNRPVNVGFSGGEKKRNEILQMALLEPSLCILDETDSGLDIDALQVVAGGVNNLRSKKRSMIVITHYQRLLDYIVPDYIHVLSGGKIVKSGGKELALELEESGYAKYTDA